MNPDDKSWKSSNIIFLLCSTLLPFLISLGHIMYVRYIFTHHNMILFFSIIIVYSFWFGFTFYKKKTFLYRFPVLFSIFYGVLPPLIDDYLRKGYRFILLNWSFYYIGIVVIIIIFTILMEYLGYLVKNPLLIGRDQIIIDGPKLGLFGGVILIITGFYELTCFLDFMYNSSYFYRPYHPCWYRFDTNNPTSLFLFISGFMTLILGISACIGAILALKNYKIGNYVLLISGIISTVGIFIPIGYSGGLGYLCICPVYLVASSGYISPFLVLIGGILTFRENSLERDKKP